MCLTNVIDGVTTWLERNMCCSTVGVNQQVLASVYIISRRNFGYDAYDASDAYGASASCLQSHFRCSFTAILPCCSAAWPAPLPLSIVTAFLGLYCLCHLLPGLLRCLCLLLLPFWAWATLSAPLPLSTFTAFLGFYCLCRSAAWPAPLYWLWLLDVATCWSYQLFCFQTSLADSNKLCPCIGTGLL